MLSRSDSMVLSLPTNTFYHNQFDFKPMARSTKPEIFTFEQIPAQLPPRAAPVRPRKKNTRVMYPAKVRKYLPPAEKNPVKRWLLILCLVVFMQIYTEEGVMENLGSADGASTDAVREEAPLAQYNVLPFQSAEEHARHMTDAQETAIPKSQQQSICEEGLSQLLNTSSQCLNEELKALYEQGRRNGYVVALLYPVYHRFGSDN